MLQWFSTRDRAKIMWSRVGKYALSAVAWGLIAGYVIYSATLVHNRRKNQTVNNIEIIIRDSAMHGNLITTPMVKGWIAGSGVKIIGQKQRELPIVNIENHMLKNGFVEQVNIYPTYSGSLRVELSQRYPSLRILVDGYNGYTTLEGYIFEAPRFASIYVPVLTGSYTPPFPSTYRGSVADFLTSERKKIRDKIAEVEQEKYPLFEREKQNNDDIRELRRMFIKKGWFESQEEFDKRVVELRAKKVELRRLYRYRSGVISKGIAKISQRQQRLREEEKKLIKRCEDFMNLVIFAHRVEQDKFWSAEIVQLIAQSTQSGGVKVSFMVRSGNAEIIFGEVDDKDECDQRFKKLMDFYQNGLQRVGWDKYKSINVEYKGQVVCK